MFDQMLRELHRRRSVDRLDIIDSPAEPAFDRFVARAARAFNAPIALITLADRDKFWFKAKAGIEFMRAPREQSFCNHVLDDDDLLEVCDATRDDRFRHFGSVAGESQLRYYIGARLCSSGSGVGAICVLDTVPRPVASPDQRAYLLALARQTAMALEMRVEARWANAA